MQVLTAPLRKLCSRHLLALAFAALVGVMSTARQADAESLLLVEADTGKVLHAENATYPWYPASVTKLMTAYVVLKAVRDGRLSLDTLLTVSPTAASQAPSKMGLPPGTQVTVDNAMKMMMVKSANDMAVVLAEGLDGTIEAFADDMNRNAAHLGMTQSHFVNPNGLPADGHVSSARDLAVLARAILHDLPEYEYFVHIPAIKFGRRITRNFNSLIGRYPGADGMKTGFICASGFNLVASATRNNKRLIAVVLGASSSSMRAYKAAQLLERGFSGVSLAWLAPSLGTVDQLAPVNADPPNLRDDMCGPHRKRQQAPESDDDNATTASGEGSSLSLFAGLQPGQLKPAEMLAQAPAAAQPVIVYTGPTKTGTALIAANAAEAESQKPKARKAHAAKPKAAGDTKQVAAKPEARPDAKSEAKPQAKSETKSDAKTAAKPASATRLAVRPAVTTAAKPKPEAKSDAATAVAKPAAKPAPKAVKPGTNADGAAKPAARKDSKKDPKPVTERAVDGAPKS